MCNPTDAANAQHDAELERQYNENPCEWCVRCWETGHDLVPSCPLSVEGMHRYGLCDTCIDDILTNWRLKNG